MRWVHGRAAWAAKAAGVCWPATRIRPSSPGRSAVCIAIRHGLGAGPREEPTLAESTRRSYLRKLDRSLNAIMVLAPTNRHGRRLRKRYGGVRGSLFTFLEHPDVPPDNNGSEREDPPQPTARLPADSDHSGAPNCSSISAQWSVPRRVVELTSRGRLVDPLN
jgi:hypothetical protein